MHSHQKPRLILLHGLHQNPLIMQPLAKRLIASGYEVYCFNYASVTKPLSVHSQKLQDWLQKNHDIKLPIYMVGHSLGGLVMRDFMARYPQWQIANCVTLGTPHLGSTTAKYAKKLLPFMVGKAYAKGLDGNVPDIPDGITLGVIAGSQAGGLGTPFLLHNSLKQKRNTIDSANDGTVYVAETQLPSATEHMVLAVSHTGMLLNKTVAQQTIHFLKHGCF